MRTQCLLNPKDTLPDNQREMTRRIEQYDMTFVFDKLVADGKLSGSHTSALEREFKRFIAIAGLGVYPLAMISPRIDDIWHQFILFTKQYKEFCQSTVGRFIGHQPDTPSTPVPIIAGENFRSAYRHYFGSLPKIWYDGMNKETKHYYTQPILTGKPPTAWSGWAGPE